MKTVSVYQESWECGDGCCSDYWVNVYLTENGKTIDRYENLRGFHKWDNEEDLKKFIIEYFDLNNEEINWDF